MKRIRIPRLVDVLISDDPGEIEALAQKPELDREYANSSLAVNRYVLRHLRKTLQVDGRLFPTITAREDQGRVALARLPAHVALVDVRVDGDVVFG